MEFTPTFIPKINKKSQKIVNKIQDIESTPNKTLNDVYSLERRRRSSYLENTIRFSNKGREKFSKTIDEIDLMSKEKKHDKSLGANKKNEKINLVQYNETNKFVVEALATKKHGKIMLKIN